jgi:hypothetical protein
MILLYAILHKIHIINAISIAFISSFLALFLQLLFGFIIFAYNKLSDKLDSMP